ncbi:MAG: hypothetical protein KDD70_16650 [Bdellovibrionales bacterium]|nr:hypothetical protein [Bdellovibrionales bacterium]
MGSTPAATFEQEAENSGTEEAGKIHTKLADASEEGTVEDSAEALAEAHELVKQVTPAEKTERKVILELPKRSPKKEGSQKAGKDRKAWGAPVDNTKTPMNY